FSGDRIVELGAVELVNHMPTGRIFHRHVNPQRAVPAEAAAIHGLTTSFLADKPIFSQVVNDFLDFIG
ncbi:DNA polymerase III subunit epsilon, partial [Amaricoccus sp. HAR-UPW-R2A-40]